MAMRAAHVFAYTPATARRRRRIIVSSSSELSATAAHQKINSVAGAVAHNHYSNKNHHHHHHPHQLVNSESHLLRLRRDYFDHSTLLTTSSSSDGGPPRWFSPLPETPHFIKHSPPPPPPPPPLLLYLPGIDGVGLGLALQHKKLGEIFDIWCLHVPIMDRTPFTDLVMFVEETVKSEHQRSPKRPIYLVGDSFGGCLALAVAARNQNIDILLILANPATCFHKSQLQSLMTLSQLVPDQLQAGLPFIFSLMTGLPSSIVKGTVEKGLPLLQTIEQLSQNALALSHYLSGLADVTWTETLEWKLKMLKSAAEYANSRLHAVKAQTLILSSGQDQLLPSQEEGERLHRTLSECQIRTFSKSGHVLFLEDGFDLVLIIKGVSFYRRGRYLDIVSDYLPPSPLEFNQIYEPIRWFEVAVDPVMLSTLENGDIVRGLAGIPSEGPVLFVGYHMMLGFDLHPLVSRLWIDKKILARGIAHPMMFTRLRDGKLPDLSYFDNYRTMGAVPASPSNLYKLLSAKSHVLLYPGGMREALHKKGEEYKLFWPENSEFVRMAARFGAKIIPFGVVGEDDIAQLLLDYDDLMRIPYFKAGIEELSNEAVKLRVNTEGEVANQYPHLPIIAPKLPGRFYFLFGKPIETQGRKQELRRSAEKSEEMYAQVKSEVEKCISYLQQKRENDPYRNILPRLYYQSIHGFHSQVPTFDLS